MLDVFELGEREEFIEAPIVELDPSTPFEAIVNSLKNRTWTGD